MEEKSSVQFINGPITSSYIERELDALENLRNTGAHQMFLGRVRADKIKEQFVTKIDYSMYPEMAEKVLSTIIKDAKDKFDIQDAYIHHSMGEVEVGKVCLLVLVNSAHRKACHEAIDYCVERLKDETPIFGKEILENEEHVWKVNQ